MTQASRTDPTTAAGRALLCDLHEDCGFTGDVTPDIIRAIEEQAAASARTSALREARAAVEGLPGIYVPEYEGGSLVGRGAVMRILGEVHDSGCEAPYCDIGCRCWCHS